VKSFTRNPLTKENMSQQSRTDLTLKTLNDAAAAAIYPPPDPRSIQALYIRRDAGRLLRSSGDATKAPTPDAPTDDDIRAFYDENRIALETGRTPAPSIFLRMSADDFLVHVTVTEQEIRQSMKATKSERFLRA